MSELKSCPFCGDTPHLMDDPTDGGKRFWWTECRECGALNAYFRTKGEAVAAWNRREPDWRALAQEAGIALKAARDGLDAYWEEIHQADVAAMVALVDKLKAAGLEV